MFDLCVDSISLIVETGEFVEMRASVTSFESGGADLGCRGSSLGRSRHLLVKVAQRGVLTFREFFNFCFGE